MDFEELKTLWSKQDQTKSFEFDQESIYKSIQAKSKAANKRIELVEISLSVMHTILASKILYDYFSVDSKGLWDLSLAIGIFIAVIILLFFRKKRKTKNNTFDRSMMGELDHAITNTQSMLHISRMMLIGYFTPVAIYCIVKLVYFNASFGKWAFIVGAFILAYTVLIWERKKLYLPRKQKLEALKKKLTSEFSDYQSFNG